MHTAWCGLLEKDRESRSGAFTIPKVAPCVVGRLRKGHKGYWVNPFNIESKIADCRGMGAWSKSIYEPPAAGNINDDEMDYEEFEYITYGAVV